MFNYDHGIPTGCKFIKVTGDDGVFYDLVTVNNAKAHIANLQQAGYSATAAKLNTVPACKLRDFTDGLNSYRDASIENGTEFYFNVDDIAKREIQTSRGGKRPGAGRPVTGRKKRFLQATDEEWALILKYADEVRKNERRG